MKKLLALTISTFFLCGCVQTSTQDCEKNNNLELCKLTQEANRLFKEADDLKQNINKTASENDLIRINSKEMTIKQCFDKYPDFVCEQAKQGLEERKQEQREAANLLQKAKQGDLDAKYEIAMRAFSGGRGIPEDPKLAKQYFTELIQKGYLKAYSPLAYLYYVYGDYSNAKRVYEQGAIKGDLDSEFKLGLLYATGTGVVQDIRKAKAIFADVCNKGSQLGCSEYRKYN